MNVSFATPMVGNLYLRDKLMEEGIADSMCHFTLAEDIVPPSLFTNKIFQRLPWFANRNIVHLLVKALGMDSDDVKVCIFSR